jgi:predicted nucleic acid-binding protein
MTEAAPPSTPATSTTDTGRPRLVLDTQVILDWLLFRDPSTARLAAFVQEGRADWIAEAGGLQEFRYVLGQSALARYEPDFAHIEAGLGRLCRVLPTPTQGQHRLICRDPDDQRFIDLALDAGATWLLSRDRAVLALAKRARAAGLLILPPSRWQPE